MAGLTPAPAKVFEFIRDYIEQNEYLPSFEEIRRHMGFRPLNSVVKNLKQLEQCGCTSIPGKNKERDLGSWCRFGPDSATSIPFLGVLAAKNPIEAVEVPQSIEVPKSFWGNGSNFALRVRGIP